MVHDVFYAYRYVFIIKGYNPNSCSIIFLKTYRINHIKSYNSTDRIREKKKNRKQNLRDMFTRVLERKCGVLSE